MEVSADLVLGSANWAVKHLSWKCLRAFFRNLTTYIGKRKGLKELQHVKTSSDFCLRGGNVKQCQHSMSSTACSETPAWKMSKPTQIHKEHETLQKQDKPDEVNFIYSLFSLLSKHLFGGRSRCRENYNIKPFSRRQINKNWAFSLIHTFQPLFRLWQTFSQVLLLNWSDVTKTVMVIFVTSCQYRVDTISQVTFHL